jgi:LL-diaminopimelate aminotransferase
MVKRNPHIAKLPAGYLFPEIAKRKKLFLEKHPSAKLISLGIGDTTEPIPHSITGGLIKGAAALGTKDGYTGYGAEQGLPELRRRLAERIYDNKVDMNEVFISDGSKCDIGRLQILFGPNATVAVQDPSYPAYVDTSVIAGQTGDYDPETKQFRGIVYMPCKPENHFFPELDKMPRADLIYFCSPNNPTGIAATRNQLKQLVAFAKRNHSIIIYDAAYAVYIRHPDFPRSIYEIEGAKEVAIELGSFSKMAGFTGVRLGWSIVPKELLFEDGTPVRQDWNRLTSTFFNGASNIAQAGALIALEPEGMDSIKQMTDFYLDNARIIKSALESQGYITYGGTDAPYIWVKFPLKSSWDTFEEMLERLHLVTTPGSGFGLAGEGFIRFTAFGHRSTIEEAASRLLEYAPLGV